MLETPPDVSALRRPTPAMFRSLALRNYALFFWGGLISNIGVWMQRTAQTWVVLQLTGGDGFALGVVTFLQFFPTLLFSIYAGVLADRIDKVRLLLVTQGLVGAESLVMAVLDGTGSLTLLQVYVLAAGLGVITAFDAPTRQSFSSELVGRDNVINAIGLNSASFNVARLVGPAVAGLAINAVGTWFVFLVHALTAVAIVSSLLRIDRDALIRSPLTVRARGQVRDGLRYIGHTPEIITFIVLACLTSAVGINSLQVVLPLVATTEFGSDALGFGLLTAALGVGGLIGALVASAGAGAPRQRWLFGSVVGLGLAQLTTSIMTDPWAFAGGLVLAGGFFMAFIVAVNTSVQLASPPDVRGRVISVYMMFFLGGGALGAPLLGALSNAIGPMGSIACAGAVSVLAGGACGLAQLWTRRRARRAVPA